jgi:hypothetical protein
MEKGNYVALGLASSSISKLESMKDIIKRARVREYGALMIPLQQCMVLLTEYKFNMYWSLLQRTA